MNPHPYLRSFLAGTFIPVLFLPVMLTGFILARLVFQLPFPIERGLVFPMAVVPALWGLWNMLWLAIHNRASIPLGAHGVVLPLVLLPSGALTAACLGILQLRASSALWFETVAIPYALIVPCFLAVLVVYYFLWKYIVGFLNQLLGIA
jgi:hypothetical protein